MFFQNLHCMFSPFTTLYQLDVQLQGSQIIQFSWVIFDMSFSQDNMKNLPNKTGPENFLYYSVSWWNNYFKLWLRKEQFFVVEKWHFVQNRFLLFVCLLSSLFFFLYTDKNDY